MDFKVIFTETFCNDLEQIVRRIAEHNPEAAEKTGGRIVDSCEKLLFFPERYPRVRLRPQFRRLIVGRVYKVFFRVDSERKMGRGSPLLGWQAQIRSAHKQAQTVG